MQLEKGKYLVELHHHMDGAFDAKLLIKLAKEKDISLPENFESELKNFKNMEDFLKLFGLLCAPVAGDADAIEACAYKVVEDQANINVAYFETRIALFLLTTESPFYNEKGIKPKNPVNTQEEALRASIRGLARGRKDFGVDFRIILATLRGAHQFNKSIEDLLGKYPEVVGIDVAGNELIDISEDEHASITSLCQTAKNKDIGITFHAGEIGLPSYIEKAVEEYSAQRIGHGYALFSDKKLAQNLKNKNIAFEICPRSAIMLPKDAYDKDYINKSIEWFLNEDINISLNSDDACFFSHLGDSVEYCQQKFNISSDKIKRIMIDSANASFLKPDEKKELVNHIQNNFLL